MALVLLLKVARIACSTVMERLVPDLSDAVLSRCMASSVSMTLTLFLFGFMCCPLVNCAKAHRDRPSSGQEPTTPKERRNSTRDRWKAVWRRIDPMRFHVVFWMSVYADQAADNPKAIYGWSFHPQQLIVWANDPKAARQLHCASDQTSLLSGIYPHQGWMFVCAIGSRRDFLARLSISHVNIVSPN